MAVGDLITATRYNALQTRVENILGNGSGTEGYGQTSASNQVAVGNEVTASHVNQLKTDIDRVNRHQTNQAAGTIASITIGDVPQVLLDAAADKLFAEQLSDYTTAISRLARYIVADGREEVIESQATGERVFNEETLEMEDVVVDMVTVTAIEPVDATIIQLAYSDDVDADPTEETIENPLITQDNIERVSAQAVVDATPQPVIDEYNS